MSETKKTVKVTLVKSPIGTGAKHRATLLGLGLKKLHQTRARGYARCARYDHQGRIPCARRMI